MIRTMLRSALLTALAVGPALAQAPAAPPTPAMQHGAMPGMPMSGNHMEMMRQMEAMNKAMMAAPMTDNPDRDLVNMMIPHHQSAIDMARIYLRDGKDPEVRRMAEKIIADQQREISEFRAWLAKNPATTR